MPAVAAITPAPAPAAANPAPAAAGNSTSAPFRLQLGDTGQNSNQSDAPVQAAKPLPKTDAKPAPGKAADKRPTSTAQPGPPAWLMAMLGGTAAPAQDAAAAAAQPATTADDGMPAAPGASSSITVAAKAETKAGGAVQPPVVAAGPASSVAAPVAGAKDGDTETADDADTVSAPPAAPPPAAALHEPAPVHAAAVETPPAPPQANPQVLADPASNVQAFARVLDAAGGDSTAAAATSAGPHASLNTGHAEWPQALADQVQWQLGRDVQEARLELHPRDLGTVQVQVRITSEGAEVRFAATHPQAREALEAALPQLRSLLQGDGIVLAQSQVGAHSSWQAPAQQQRQPQAGQGAAAAPTADEEPAAAAPRVLRIGLVDDFA